MVWKRWGRLLMNNQQPTLRRRLAQWMRQHPSGAAARREAEGVPPVGLSLRGRVEVRQLRMLKGQTSLER